MVCSHYDVNSIISADKSFLNKLLPFLNLLVRLHIVFMRYFINLLTELI